MALHIYASQMAAFASRAKATVRQELEIVKFALTYIDTSRLRSRLIGHGFEVFEKLISGNWHFLLISLSELALELTFAMAAYHRAQKIAREVLADARREST